MTTAKSHTENTAARLAFTRPLKDPLLGPPVMSDDIPEVVDLVDAGLGSCDRAFPHPRHEFTDGDRSAWCAGAPRSPEAVESARAGVAAIRALIDPATGRTHDHGSLR
ncbi:hypothetical protein [Nocardioides sp. SYSU DS0663]|uniref:hypothetical protein n=1 Tax=Nocardioides sp. SYSU DS0663 TaxID=3416445 RepID=UPI003F4C295F